MCFWSRRNSWNFTSSWRRNFHHLKVCLSLNLHNHFQFQHKIALEQQCCVWSTSLFTSERDLVVWDWMENGLYLRLVLPRQYATVEAFESPGAHILRPWMLPHRSDYGLRGTCDVEHWIKISMALDFEKPFQTSLLGSTTLLWLCTYPFTSCDCLSNQEVQKCLAQLIGMNSFLSNPDIPGTEKLVICGSDDRWLSNQRIYLSPREIGDLHGNLLAPQSVFAVKGFNRSTCALLVILACYELVPLMEAGSILCYPRYLVGQCGTSADVYCIATCSAIVASEFWRWCPKK